MTTQSEAEVIVDTRQLVSVEGVPIHILGRAPAHQFARTRVFNGHRSIYVASVSSLHPGDLPTLSQAQASRPGPSRGVNDQTRCFALPLHARELCRVRAARRLQFRRNAGGS